MISNFGAFTCSGNKQVDSGTVACKQGVLPDFAEDHRLSGEGLASVGAVTTGCVNQRLMARALPVLTAIMLFTGRDADTQLLPSPLTCV